MWFFRSQPQPPAPFFEWSNPEHSTGVSMFDQEHRQLAAMISQVHAALVQERDRAKARQLMERLIHETRAHFVHEETVMAEASVPDLEAHGAEHAALLQEAHDLLRQFHAGSISALALPIFLKNWLIRHIQGTDRKYAPVLRRHGLR